MAKKKLSPNAQCPCGSGQKYKRCCFNKGFHYVVDEDGSVSRLVPMPDEVRDLLAAQLERFKQKHGREPRPDDLLFDPEDVPSDEEAVRMLKDAGAPPAVIHVFRRTGYILTEMNRHLIPEAGMKEIEEALMEFETTGDEVDE